jgi:hypothetical protein
MRCLQGSLGVGELQRWAEHCGAKKPADRARGSSRPKRTRSLGAQHLKFNLHAGVSVRGGLPAAREGLLRYCARPRSSGFRCSKAAGSGYRIKDGDQMRLMTPTQFMARLAALVPPPRMHLLRYFGPLSSHHAQRCEVTPSPAPEAGLLTPPPAPGDQQVLPLDSADAQPPRSGRARWGWLIGHVFLAESIRPGQNFVEFTTPLPRTRVVRRR